MFALHIPYRGSGPLITDLIGGQVQYSVETMTAATPHVKSGKVIAVAQTRPQRSQAYPDVPTVAERLNAAGAEDAGGTPERFADFMRAERTKYTALVKDAGIKIDS